MQIVEFITTGSKTMFERRERKKEQNKCHICVTERLKYLKIF